MIAFLQGVIKQGDRAMVDLCVLAGKTFFHPDTQGNNSIKKALPAVLKISDALRQIYGQPVYGAPGGIPSRNFSSEKGFAWIDVADMDSCDPYARLKLLANDLLPEGADKDSVIAEGGAVATAYARLQFEDMDATTRERIKSALLRYCELDTLAMVMVVQAWREMLDRSQT